MKVSDQKLKKLEEKISDLENKWRRTLADYDNLEKRVKKEKTAFVKLANAALLDKLLAVLDDLERVEKHSRDKGLKLTIEQFKKVLRVEGVEEIEVKEKEFEAESMDCLEVVDGSRNKVIEVVNKGYRLGDYILRPAKVRVGGGKSKN